MTPNFSIYAPLFIASLLLFSWSCYRRLALVAVGRPENRFENPGRRILEMFLYAFGQKRVMAKPFGLNHAVIFWAFLILLLANGEFLIAGLFPALAWHCCRTRSTMRCSGLRPGLAVGPDKCDTLPSPGGSFAPPVIWTASYVKAQKPRGLPDPRHASRC